MSERPTPEEIAGVVAEEAPTPTTLLTALLDRLAAHGYRIVHPDDVPPGYSHQGWAALLGDLKRRKGQT